MASGEGMEKTDTLLAGCVPACGDPACVVLAKRPSWQLAYQFRLPTDDSAEGRKAGDRNGRHAVLHRRDGSRLRRAIPAGRGRSDALAGAGA